MSFRFTLLEEAELHLHRALALVDQAALATPPRVVAHLEQAWQYGALARAEVRAAMAESRPPAPAPASAQAQLKGVIE